MTYPDSLLPPAVLEDLVETARNTPPGCIVEVGVFNGGSACRLAELDREIYLYDTFTGLPCKGKLDVHEIGEFMGGTPESLQALIPKAKIIQGIFPGSAVKMPPVAFAHIDCDQYQSVFESAFYLNFEMVPGGIMWFDDYGCLAGATAAVDELFGDRIRTAKCGKAYVIL